MAASKRPLSTADLERVLLAAYDQLMLEVGAADQQRAIRDAQIRISAAIATYGVGIVTAGLMGWF